MASLDQSDCRARFGASPRAVLSTVHPIRGVDAVPTVFAPDGDVIWTPIDTLKPKRSPQLTRLENIEADPRVCLLADHWDDDWTQLWWVRVHGSARPADPAELDRATEALGDRYPQYREPGSIGAAIRIEVAGWTGWAGHA